MEIMESKTPVSKSQKRALALLNLADASTYEAAAELLVNAGYRRDAIPAGQTWRTAAKMADADLLSAIKAEHDDYEPADRYY